MNNAWRTMDAHNPLHNLPGILWGLSDGPVLDQFTASTPHLRICVFAYLSQNGGEIGWQGPCVREVPTLDEIRNGMAGEVLWKKFSRCGARTFTPSQRDAIVAKVNGLDCLEDVLSLIDRIIV